MSRTRLSRSNRNDIDVIDVESFMEENIDVPKDKIDQLKGMLGPVSEARCKDLLIAADMDLDRALNHYFDQIEQSKVKSKPASQSKGSSSSTSASTSSSSLRSSSTPSARTRASRAAPVSLKVKQPRMQLASLAKRRKKQVSEDDEEDDADEKKGNNDSDDDSDNSDGDFKYASSLISPARSSRPSRTAKPTSFKPVKKTKSAATKKKTASVSASASSSSRPTKKQKKSLSDDEEDESEDSLFGHDSDDEEASLSKDDDSDDDDDDDDDSDDDGFNMLPFMNILFRRRRPAAPRRRRVRVRVRSRSRADNSDDDDGDAPARGGGGGGWGRRRGGGARARVQALRTQFNTLVTPDVIAKQPEDDDPVRLRQVVTWNEPPPPINPIALGINFPDEYASRRRWNVGTLVDCDIGDGRGWERAKIVNILFAPRTNALSYDVTFENRRADIPPGVIFRFNATDEYHLANAYEHEDRFVAQPGDGMAKNGTKGGPAKKGASTAKKNNSAAAAAANAGPTKYTISDFRQYQLVDVKIGKRWFLGLVQGSRFSATPDGYADILDVQLVDFHPNCARRYQNAQLDQLDPIVYSHPLTHYPQLALPTSRDKEVDTSAVYATRDPAFAWSSELQIGKEDEDDPDGPSEEKQAIIALPSAPAAVANDRPSRAAAAAASSSSAAAAAVPPKAVSTRPIGEIDLTVVSDCIFSNASKSFLHRVLPCRSDDPFATSRSDGRPLTREESLKRLMAMCEFNRRALHTFVATEITMREVHIGLPESTSVNEDNKASLELEERYRKQIHAQFFKPGYLMANDKLNVLMKSLKLELNELEKKRQQARRVAIEAGHLKPDDSDPESIQEEEDQPLIHSSVASSSSSSSPAAAAAASSASSSTDVDSEVLARYQALAAAMPFVASMSKKLLAKTNPTIRDLVEFEDEDEPIVAGHSNSKSKSAKNVPPHPHDGRLRWYKLCMTFSLVRKDAKNPKKTSEEASPLNDLMLLLYPESKELKRLTREATKPMPSYLPNSLTLNGLLKHSAHFHHGRAEEIQAGEEKKKADRERERDQPDHGEQKEEAKYGDLEERKGDSGSALMEVDNGAVVGADVSPESVWLNMDSSELSRAAGLIPTITLKDYQIQTVHWMIHAERPESNVSQCFWVTLTTKDGCKFQYSPFLQRFTFSPHPNVKGGWICEEMGLGKTIEALALINLKSESDRLSAHREIELALADQTIRQLPPLPKTTFPIVRDQYGTYISRATLIICPVSLISQWMAELKEKSARPLKILCYHGNRPKDPRALVDYDIVITAYSILSVESNMISSRSRQAALFQPWDYHGPAGLQYSSPLGQVHWRRVVLDESQAVKNAATEVSQQANKLLGRCRYLMSGTPFGNSLMDLRGQTRFLGLTGFGGTHLFNSLYRFMQSQRRYSELALKVRPDDYEGVPYRVGEWLKRFRNVFTWLVTRCMVRHEKSMVFRGRDTLFVLPAARVEVVRVDLTPTQRAAYKLLYEFACKRFQLFKESGDAVRKTIEVLQLLVPLRQACSVDSVDIDQVKRQLRDIARGIVAPSAGRAVGGASAASLEFPQATEYAFGSLNDECTICLDVLEDALQTICRHCFCKECILALCESRGADSVCPVCRRPIGADKLFAPLILESEEDKKKREALEAQEAEEKRLEEERTQATAAAAAAATSEPSVDAAASSAASSSPNSIDADVDMEHSDPNGVSASPASSSASSSANGNKKRKRNDNEEGEDDELEGDEANGDEEKMDGEGEEAKAAEEVPVEVNGIIAFDSKLNALLHELRMMKMTDPTAKALIFTQFRQSMDKIQAALKESGIGHEMLMGHYTLAQRKKALERFRSDPSTSVFILSVRAAAAGLTLTSANYVYIVEPGFNPAVTLQAIGRVWRFGQQKQVNVRYMVCAETVEETILVIAREKMASRSSASSGDADDHSTGANLSLLPEMKGSQAAIAAAAAAAAPSAPPASASPSSPASSSDDDGISEADRLRGRIPRSRPSRGQQEESNQERAGRGVVMGHATNADAIPDLRLSELERLFAI